MKKTYISGIAAGAVVLLVLFGLMIILVPSERSEDNQKHSFCTQEVKECEDGSFVSRNHNNNCEFDSCLKIINEQGTYIEQQTFSPNEDVEVRTFASMDELESFIEEHQSSGYGGGVYRGGVMMDMAMPMMAKTESATFDGGSVDYSETNNQVLGIDEADIIKTDGEYIYTISGKTLYIIKAFPGDEAEIVSKNTLKNRPSGIFIEGNKLAIFGDVNDLDFFKEVDYTPKSGMSFIDVYNIEDKENIELLKDYKFDGNYFEGRMYEGYIYIFSVTRPQNNWPGPVFYEGVVREELPFNKIFYYNVPYDNPVFVNVFSLNLEDPEELNTKSVVVEGSQNLYMYEDNAYITYTEYINEWEIRQDILFKMVRPLLVDSDKILVEKIKNTDNDVLSQSEKENKIMQIINNHVNYKGEEEQENLYDELESRLKEKLEEYEYFEYTIINKIGIDEGEIKVKDSGKVPGHIMNQFSMDEHNGAFRIATTISARWSSYIGSRTETTNHIFTLDNDLEIIDHEADIAEGESIYSTRFIEDRLYMVTFKQVDPFFVYDLSNPKEIEVLGELKIPGFSRYLHPYDDNTIIGIGRDATDTGRTKGLKISLFNVEDVENPEEIAKFVTEERYAQSSAEYEHKAFLFDKEKELLVIPAYHYDWEDQDGYNGAMVFKITSDEIEMRGIIDHSMGTEQRYSAMVERSLFIEDMLYTKSPNLLRINSLDTLEGVKKIELDNKNTPYLVY